jgi:hypothetical protein
LDRKLLLTCWASCTVLGNKCVIVATCACSKSRGCSVDNVVVALWDLAVVDHGFINPVGPKTWIVAEFLTGL